MTDIYREIIDHPSAWTAASLGGKAALTRELGAAEIAAFRAFLDRTRHLAPQAVTRRDFDGPVLDALCDALREEIMNGRGIVILAGLDPAAYSAEELERIYWGIGTHLGHAAVQSRSGDRLGRVEQEDADPVARGYRSSAELNMHTDSYEVVGLMCLRQAARGGQSGMASALAIHNEILRTRPDLLPPLYEGFRYAIPEAQTSSKPVTDVSIPVFCNVDGRVSCMYAGSFMRNAAKKLGQPLPPGLEEALDYFAALAERDDIALRFMLEPGEMMIWHNFVALHSRTNFENDATHRRLLLRLWLNVPNGRPVVPSFYVRGQTYDAVYAEYSRVAS